LAIDSEDHGKFSLLSIVICSGLIQSGGFFSLLFFTSAHHGSEVGYASSLSRKIKLKKKKNKKEERF